MTHQGKDLVEELLVVLVLYKTRWPECDAYLSLSKSLKEKRCCLFVYDNSPERQACTSESFDITYRHDPNNSGVSKGYNEGFQMANSLNKRWMLLADQDTQFPENFFQVLDKYVHELSSHRILVPIVRSGKQIISPFKLAFGRGFTLSKIKPGISSLSKLNFINSGLLISTDLFELAGGYDERFPLDFSDISFSERLRTYQSKLVVTDINCQHHLSSEQKSKEDAVVRFRYYLKASKLFGVEQGQEITFTFARTLRMLRLTLQYGSLDFFKTYIKKQE
jgi:rhamnosyltransferase